MKKIILLLCLFWMGFIFYMSSNNGQISHQKSNKVVNLIESIQTKLETGDKDIIINEKRLKFLVRKNAHVFIYMVLALLVSSMFFIFNKRGKNAVVYILFICLIFAIADEFNQSFIPQRTSSVRDVLIDFTGSLIGLGLFYLAYYKIYDNASKNVEGKYRYVYSKNSRGERGRATSSAKKL